MQETIEEHPSSPPGEADQNNPTSVDSEGHDKIPRSGSVADLIDAFGGKTAVKSAEKTASGSDGDFVVEPASSPLPHSKESCSNSNRVTSDSHHALPTAVSLPTSSAVGDGANDDDAQSEATTEGADSPGSSAPASPLRYVAAGGYSLADPPILYAR